jgi:hypothetical protein
MFEKDAIGSPNPSSSHTSKVGKVARWAEARKLSIYCLIITSTRSFCTFVCTLYAVLKGIDLFLNQLNLVEWYRV